MTTQIVAIQLDQVEGVQEYAVIVAPITNDIERSYAVGIAADRLAIDYAGASAGASTSQRSAESDV
jgi:hypothetical protein